MKNLCVDIVVIGGGPAGYKAALRAASRGFKVACIEKENLWGGTCLRQGCIPSKALLHGAELYAHFPGYAAYGVSGDLSPFDLKALQKKKQSIVAQLSEGVDFLLKKKDVISLKGRAQVLDGQTAQVQKKEGNIEVKADRAIILATGSQVFWPENVKKTPHVFSSDEALDLKAIPSSMIVVGAGYIGLELGLFWRRLGAEVTLIEAGQRLLPAVDEDVALVLRRAMEDEGVVFHFNTSMESVKQEKDGVCVITLQKSQKKFLKAEKVLLALGRKPFTEGLGLESRSVQLTERGFVKVGDDFQTSLPGVYAVGDLIEGPMLAHRAEKEAEVLVDYLAGKGRAIDYATLPSVIYTDPQIASVGFSEAELRPLGQPFLSAKAFFKANGRAKAAGWERGFLKLLARPDSGLVLGVHIVGCDAETLIDKGVMALSMGATVFDIHNMFHAHPTLGELYADAAWEICCQIANANAN